MHPILEHLRVASAPPSLDLLHRVLLAWAQRIPWESASRIARHQHPGTPEVYARAPDAFFAHALQLGTGGTCFESNLALRSLLDRLNFNTTLAFCDMRTDTPDPHCAVVVTLDDAQYLADAGYPIPGALLLDSEVATAINTPVYRYCAHPIRAEQWQIQRQWGHQHDRPHAQTVFSVATTPIPLDRFIARLQADHAPDGLFLDKVIMHRVHGESIWRYSEEKGLIHRNAGREEAIPLEGDIPCRLARLFRIDERVIRAALDRQPPDPTIWSALAP